ncbi:MAG TPA: hypothetical protein VGC98_15705 [Thermoleophilaceae bacterium]
MHRPRLIAAIPVASAALVLATGPSSVAKAPYTTTSGPSRADAKFAVTYQGKGSYSTTFHATPPNPGGKPDTNDAHDTSTQAWNVKFRRALTIPTCGQPSVGDDPCASLDGLSGASGPTNMTGKVNHKHVDGLYKQLDRTVRCTLRVSPSKKRRLEVSLATRYIPESNSIGVSVSDPMSTTISFFPTQCPKQGDSIDRILDFYATPGFSFAQDFGPERWFASREVVIPSDVFHRSAAIKIPLHLTANGTPPKHCARPNPSYERCKTGGAWNGVLTLKAKN